MKKYYLFLPLFIILMLNHISAGSVGRSKFIQIDRELQAAVDEPGQKQELYVPAEPLAFDTTLNWEVTVSKKGLAVEKEPAYFIIEETGSTSRQIQKSIASASGSLVIPKGTRYKVTLNAGEYSLLLLKSGAEVKTKLKYAEALIKYSQGDRPYLFNFEISGPAGLTEWRWDWGNNQYSNGSQVTYQFKRDGKTPVIVTGKGEALSGEDSRQFYFELDVPPLIVLNPKIEPLRGPVELTVNAQANAVVNYGQKAFYIWNFGNGVELTGPEAQNTYVKPGKYLLTLTAKADEYRYEKSWLVEAEPLSVTTNAVVTPTSGPVPLEVKGVVTPKVNGGPAQLQFMWDIAGEKQEGAVFTKKITEPGEYRIVLKTTDKLHPELAIPDEVIIVKAVPPQITLTPLISLSKGFIPFAVSFEPGAKVEGSPAELIYYWDFGDGEISRQEKPRHVYRKPGQYQAQLIVSDRLHPGNLAMAAFKIEALPPEMKVTALASVNKGLAPLTVNFDAQVGITGSPCAPLYRWNFGDGAVSFEPNPVHTFRQEGAHAVELEVKDRLHPENVVKTTLLIETRLPKLRLTASVTPLSGNAPLTVFCRAWGEKEGSSDPKLKYTWDFGDGNKAEGMDQKYTYHKQGSYNVTVTIEDRESGLTEQKSFKVTVK